MRPGGGRTKGHAFEKKVAREVSIWWTGEKSAFWRNLGSGGPARSMPTKGLHPGDIVPVKELRLPFLACIECKKTESWSWDELIRIGKRADVMQYWRQCVSERAELDPWLVFAKNRSAPLIMLSSKRWYATLRQNDFTIFAIRGAFNSSFYDSVVVSWKLFRDKFKPVDINSVIKNNVL